MRMLIADDNQQILNVLKAYAVKEDFEADLATNGRDALLKAQAGQYDIILLDVMMPLMDGFAVCRELRKTSIVPVLMITARSEDYDRIMGLDIGADDYVVKPFSPGEVMARVRAILRRTERQSQNKYRRVLRVGELEVRLETAQVMLCGDEITLTKKEIDLLRTLASNPGKVFSRDNLLDSLWGFDYFGDIRTVDSHIKRLRAKLDIHPHPEWSITTIWRMGYKFEVMRECRVALQEN